MAVSYTNPVCYNGLNRPNRDAVSFGPVSLGTVRKDYTTLINNNWRAGINPGINTVIYTDTYSRGVDTQAAAVPSIHWISGQSQANITELISRLPERSANNYELFADYATAIAWLIGTYQYMLVNTKYPEYLLPPECAANIELGFLASYPGTDIAVYDLISNNNFGAVDGAFVAPSAGSFVGYFETGGNNGRLETPNLRNATGNNFNGSLVVEGVFYQDRDLNGHYLVGTLNDSISIIVDNLKITVKSGNTNMEFRNLAPLQNAGIFHMVAYVPAGAEDPNDAKLWINGVDMGMPAVSGSGLASRSVPSLCLCESAIALTHATTTRVYGFKAYEYGNAGQAISDVPNLATANYAAISTIYGI